MKINKNSWHYKLVSSFYAHIRRESDMPKSLCSYFWHVVGAVGYILSAVIALLVAVVIGLTPVIAYFHTPTLLSGIWAPGLILDFIALLFPSLALLEYYKPLDKLFKKKEVDKHPSIIIEYLKAKKRKICPLIEYEE